ncbi:MAG TPA: hypothetical protein VEB20_20490 [Azospirillaceae bacterium]|nr:hypothetical protein [Azospirillaceae bacterium]
MFAKTSRHAYRGTMTAAVALMLLAAPAAVAQVADATSTTPAVPPTTAPGAAPADMSPQDNYSTAPGANAADVGRDATTSPGVMPGTAGAASTATDMTGTTGTATAGTSATTPSDTTATDTATTGTAASGTAASGTASTGTTTTYGTATGSTGGSAGSATASTGGDAEVLAEIDKPTDLGERKGPAQRELALMQTTLLNRFSQLGFSDVREFRREGESYVAEAQTAEGQWVTVVMDPASGTIVARR